MLSIITHTENSVFALIGPQAAVLCALSKHSPVTPILRQKNWAKLCSCVCVCVQKRGKKSSDYMNRGCSCHWGDSYRPNQPKFMRSRSGTVNKQGCKDKLELRYMRLF